MTRFNWVKFHKDLDVALATWIMEDPDASIHAEFLKFLEFSYNNQLERNICFIKKLKK